MTGRVEHGRLPKVKAAAVVEGMTAGDDHTEHDRPIPHVDLALVHNMDQHGAQGNVHRHDDDNHRIVENPKIHGRNNQMEERPSRNHDRSPARTLYDHDNIRAEAVAVEGTTMHTEDQEESRRDIVVAVVVHDSPLRTLHDRDDHNHTDYHALHDSRNGPALHILAEPASDCHKEVRHKVVGCRGEDHIKMNGQAEEEGRQHAPSSPGVHHGKSKVQHRHLVDISHQQHESVQRKTKEERRRRLRV